MTQARRVPAVHGVREVPPDPPEEIALADRLRCGPASELAALVARHAAGDTAEDRQMRRVAWRAMTQQMGHGVQIGRNALIKHPETIALGTGVFIGEQAFIQGRYDGRCVIGDHVWLGPQSYFDARDLVIGDYVGWGPGARVLGSEHAGDRVDVPIIQTDLVIKPVRIGAWSDVGVNAVVLPGVTIGKGAVIGAGAVVVEDVPDFAVVAGVPARFIRWRDGR